MKPIGLIILIAAVLVTLVTGCGGAHRYDARLVAADSLMWTVPDSAMAVVEGITDTMLRSEGDRAYRDLLLTQARYKCYADITAADDSAITRAMDYFSSHNGDREKLTRATLYKGAVMEELGHVDSAMYYYKTAEVNADEKDYTNLGQINTRIGSLYRYYYGDMQTCYDKYDRALKYYILTGNKRLQFDCLFKMAGCSGITRIGNPEKLLTQATKLAIELNDSASIFKSQELLCRQWTYSGDSIVKAKKLAIHCLNDFSHYINHNLLLDLAEIYAKSGMPDSARYYLDYVTEDASASNLEQIKTRKYSILSIISRLEGNSALSTRYDMLSHQVSDSILNDNKKYQIQQIENSFIDKQHTSFLSKISSLQWMIIGLAVAAILLISLLLAVHLRRLHRTWAIIQELQNTSTKRHEQLIGQLDDKNSVVEQMLTNLIALIKTIAANGTHNSTVQVARQIKENLTDVADDKFWIELRAYLDKRHNGIISQYAQTHHLTDKDLHFIELCLCGFNNAEIAIILGYALKYISNKRKTLTEKLGINLYFKSVSTAI